MTAAPYCLSLRDAARTSAKHECREPPQQSKLCRVDKPTNAVDIYTNIAWAQQCTHYLSLKYLSSTVGGSAVVELLRLNDPVKLSFLEALLRDGGIQTFILDQHMSVLEGSASAIPRRLMVTDDDAERARFILHQAEELDGPA